MHKTVNLAPERATGVRIPPPAHFALLSASYLTIKFTLNGVKGPGGSRLHQGYGGQAVVALVVKWYNSTLVRYNPEFDSRRELRVRFLRSKNIRRAKQELIFPSPALATFPILLIELN